MLIQCCLFFSPFFGSVSGLLLFLGDTPKAYGGSQARGQIAATSAGLHHSHSSVGFEPHL